MHRHNFQQGEWSKRTGKTPTVLVCKCGAFRHVSTKNTVVITEAT